MRQKNNLENLAQLASQIESDRERKAHQAQVEK